MNRPGDHEPETSMFDINIFKKVMDESVSSTFVPLETAAGTEALETPGTAASMPHSLSPAERSQRAEKKKKEQIENKK